jgi:hypothetical protein
MSDRRPIAGARTSLSFPRWVGCCFLLWGARLGVALSRGRAPGYWGMSLLISTEGHLELVELQAGLELRAHLRQIGQLLDRPHGAWVEPRFAIPDRFDQHGRWHLYEIAHHRSTVNQVATALLRQAHPIHTPDVYGPVLIMGTGTNGTDTDVPEAVLQAAQQLAGGH